LIGSKWILFIPGSIGDFHGLGEGNFATSTGHEAIAAFSNGPWVRIYLVDLYVSLMIIGCYTTHDILGIITIHDGKSVLNQSKGMPLWKHCSGSGKHYGHQWSS